MKKLLLLFSILIGFATNVNSQCNVTATASENNLVCGQCVDLTAVGLEGTLVMNNDFNNSTLGSGWTSSSTVQYNNPCGPSLDGTSSAWFGNVPFPRTLTTTTFDVSCGGQVCFDLDFAGDDPSSPNDCEDPDEPDEGVFFQYSTDGGATWNTIFYFDPTAFTIPNGYYSWDNYCFTIPAAAQTTNTMFQWTQPNATTELYDHWGIDNVQILANDCNYYYDWAHIPGSPDNQTVTVCPNSTSTYNVIYTNGINDTCSTSITVNVLFPDVDVTATVNPITNCGDCTQLDATLTNIPPDSCCYTLNMQDSWGDGWNGGQLIVNTPNGNLGPFAAVGNGSVETFCVPDGTTFTLQYTSGSWEGENTYDLIDPSGNNIFNDGPNPATGNVFTSTASCGTAPPNYVWNWTGNNLTAINDSTQTACPTGGSWYYVEVSANGCTTIDSIFIDYTPTPSNTTENTSVCSGTIYVFPDGSSQTITTNTTQTSTLTDINGCDSIITTNITISPSINVTVNDVICSGDSYTFPDGTTQTNITANTTQVSTLTSTIIGCDSIITTNITVNPVYNLNETATICSGDSYTFPDGTTQAGINNPVSYVSNLTTVNGCDSIITTNISIDLIYNISETDSVCDGDSYTFPDGTTMNTIINPVTYVSNLTTVNGCDSIITTNIVVNPVYSIAENVNVCNGSSYTFPDGTTQNNINSPTTHISNLTTIEGCDSIITTSVGVFASYNTTVDTVVCDGTNYTFSDGTTQIIGSFTSYTSTLTSTDGCDSLVTENINIYPTYNLTENYDQCPGLSFTFPDGTTQNNINSDVTYTSNLLTVNGCDSIITTNINIYDLPQFDISFSPNGCPDLSMVITNNTNGTDCQWNIEGPMSSTNYSGCSMVSDVFVQSGFYDVTLTMLSPDGCPMDTTISSAFEVYPQPIADFTWDPTEGTITDNTINFTNQSIGGDDYYWNFGDGYTSNSFNDSHAYSDSGDYQVELIIDNNYGCSDTATGLVIINEEFSIFVPNSFTPDGDAYNNTFRPILRGYDPQSYQLLIFNRWGEVIFESLNAEVGWDGHYVGRLSQDGVYVWKVKVKTWSAEPREYIGHVTLIK